VNSQVLDSVSERGFILAANHVSYLDWLVLWAYLEKTHGVRPTFLAKERLFSHPLWKTVVTPETCIQVADSGDQISPAEYRKLRRCKHLVIFPEGTRSRTGELLEFRGGVVRLAQKMKLPVVPVALLGFYEAWPPGQPLPSARKCEIRIGELIEFSELCNASDMLRDRIAGLLSDSSESKK
jgi:1-acyl-sn-glycerol-3-phosphate acyltransferase